MRIAVLIVGGLFLLAIGFVAGMFVPSFWANPRQSHGVAELDQEKFKKTGSTPGQGKKVWATNSVEVTVFLGAYRSSHGPFTITTQRRHPSNRSWFFTKIVCPSILGSPRTTVRNSRWRTNHHGFHLPGENLPDNPGPVYSEY